MKTRNTHPYIINIQAVPDITYVDVEHLFVDSPLTFEHDTFLLAVRVSIPLSVIEQGVVTAPVAPTDACGRIVVSLNTNVATVQCTEQRVSNRH